MPKKLRYLIILDSRFNGNFSRLKSLIDKGFVDLFFDPFLEKYADMEYAYLVELKYIKRGEYTETLKLQKIKEAEKQLKQYGSDERTLERIGDRELKKIVLVFSGWELVGKEEVQLSVESDAMGCLL